MGLECEVEFDEEVGVGTAREPIGAMHGKRRRKEDRGGMLALAVPSDGSVGKERSRLGVRDAGEAIAWVLQCLEWQQLAIPVRTDDSGLDASARELERRESNDLIIASAVRAALGVGGRARQVAACDGRQHLLHLRPCQQRGSARERRQAPAPRWRQLTPFRAERRCASRKREGTPHAVVAL